MKWNEAMRLSGKIDPRKATMIAVVTNLTFHKMQKSQICIQIQNANMIVGEKMGYSFTDMY